MQPRPTSIIAMVMLARLRWLVVITVLGSLIGFLGSFLIQPRYIARAVIEGPRMSDVPLDKAASEKLATYLEQVLSLESVRPLIEREGIAQPEEVEKEYEEIRKNTKLQPALDDEAALRLVDLIYTDSTPQRAEKVCAVLTTAILEKTRTDSEAAVDAATSFIEQALQESAAHVRELRNRMLEHPLDREVARAYRKARESHEDLASAAVHGGLKVPANYTNFPTLFIGGDVHPQGAGVLLPCTSGTRDFTHSILCAEIGSVVGLFVGLALVSIRRKSLRRIAEPHC